MKLTQQQIDQYHSQGYVILGSIFSKSEIEELRAEEQRFRTAKKVPESEKNQTMFFNQLFPYSEPIRRLSSTGKHIEIAKQLISPNLLVWFNQFVTKMPDGASGKSEFPWHQDNGYVPITPATNLTIWVALDDVDTQNGCVWVVPESHKKGLIPHVKKSENSWYMEIKVDGDGVPAVLKAGEAIAFTGLTLHRSKLNHSSKPRRAFFMEYADAASTMNNEPLAKAGNTIMVSGQLPYPG